MDWQRGHPDFPLGVDILSTYATLGTGSGRVAVVLWNNTDNWVEVNKGTPIARMVPANQMPSIDGIVGASKPLENLPALTKADRHGPPDGEVGPSGIGDVA